MLNDTTKRNWCFIIYCSRLWCDSSTLYGFQIRSFLSAGEMIKVSLFGWKWPPSEESEDHCGGLYSTLQMIYEFSTEGQFSYQLWTLLHSKMIQFQNHKVRCNHNEDYYIFNTIVHIHQWKKYKGLKMLYTLSTNKCYHSLLQFECSF